MLIKVRRGGKVIGEYPVAAVRVRLRNQSILPTDEYWTEGMSRWESVSGCKNWNNFSVPLEQPPVQAEVAADAALAVAVPAVAIQGKVLEYNAASASGLISADSGARYTFSGAQWRSGATRPAPGVRVEFVPAGALATGIYATESPAMVATSKRPGLESRVYIRPSPQSADRKDRAAYILLAVLLGIGVHNFYAGYKKTGLTQILCTFLSCFVLWPFMWIWAIIEACTVERDANGVRFK